MPMTKEEAKQWAFKNSKYLKLGDGESFTAKLKDFKAIPNRFDPDKEVIRYTFEFPDGSVKYWENGRGSVLEAMTDLLGKMVVVNREGSTANDTKYEVGESLD